MISARNIISTIIISFLLSACSVSKYVPTGEKLYEAGTLKLTSDEKIKNLSEVNDELQSLLRPTPNSSFIGMKIGLHAYYKAQTGKSGFINKFVNKRFGEKPVYLSDINVSRTEELILNRLENRGFYRSELTSKVNEKEQSASVKYIVNVSEPYRLRNYEILGDSLAVHGIIREAFEETDIKPGLRFSLDRFKEERDRIDAYLKMRGYYNFNADFLIFEADTNKYETKEFDLYLRLKDDVPRKSVVPYNVSEIVVYPNYGLNDATKTNDTTYVDSVAYVQDEIFFRPDRLSTYLLINKGERYSARASALTSDRLSSIGTYRYINIRYDNLHPVADTDTLGHLKAFIALSPLSKRSVRAELQAVSKSNNFVGPGLALSYTNRNLFQGGEILSFTGNVGYERQITNQASAGLSSTQLGLKSQLTVPHLLFPIDLKANFKYSVPKTNISAAVEFLNRSKLYQLNSVLTTFGYSWKASKHIYHELTPISINFVKLSNTTSEFDKILGENAFLKSSFDQQFIAGLTYTFTYNELTNPKKTNPIYLSIFTDIAGNGLNLLSNATTSDGLATFLGQEFAQYFKTDLDLRYHYRITGSQKLVGRIFAGAGYPYGNSVSLPYSKQYFSGGPYSVRAFRIRSIGPGTYQPKDGDTGSFFDQAGDIRLEGNLEYRFPIYSFFKGAVFMDAGNVWLINENTDLPGSKFSSNFMKELAIGSGIGLRVDIQNFVIRLDLATPLKKPWTTLSPEFAPVFNFAIGYPF